MEREYLLTLNPFKAPQELTGVDAINYRLLYISLLEPGTLPDFPNAGLGLKKRFRYLQDKNIEELKTEYGKQIGTYLPDLQGVDVRLAIKNKMLYIQISIDKYMFEYIYNGQNMENLTLDDMKTEQDRQVI